MQRRRVLPMLVPFVFFASGCTTHPSLLSRHERNTPATTQTQHQNLPIHQAPQTPQESRTSKESHTPQNSPAVQVDATPHNAHILPGPQQTRKTQAAKKPPQDPRPLSTGPLRKAQEAEERHYYASLERNLRTIRREIEEGGYILDETNNPKILKKSLLQTYDGFRLTFKAKEGKHLPILERKVEQDLEERYAKNFRRIYRGKMSKIQEGIYVVDFIPQEHIQMYKKHELHMP